MGKDFTILDAKGQVYYVDLTTTLANGHIVHCHLRLTGATKTARAIVRHFKGKN